MSTPNFENYQIRIMNDIINFNKNKFTDIFININKNNICNIDALIIGPKGTPYENGLYFFELIFTKKYPYEPPTVFFKTIDGDVRFNPNLYANGKVCLSILGTWQGPGWKSVMTLTSILLSLQTLLHENPIINEPGQHHQLITGTESINYNNYIIYHNFRLAINEVLFNKYFSNLKNKFKKQINLHLKNNLEKIKQEFKSYKLILNNLTLERTMFSMKETFINFDSFEQNILNLKSV
ncbi:putative ubiquitin-conjugating enzyme E2 [Cafeteria roenbergensis virus]|uniref:E2 ubiquitin-conjugating enzyme n=1 Tax=Cafeteria roenbergensis virus (strain BV-PW1) TaxID=693272 RepID=E3T5R4_CROVB|nr:putative ubiquitin-conjugating enzyme E2 [Cafeteria roenbergensis virus BV-PW1]ADO67527.1 putative ubiquitin-conjugating enzyme E2 [Cafeteria roenbergensis virus BV-PW1]